MTVLALTGAQWFGLSVALGAAAMLMIVWVSHAAETWRLYDEPDPPEHWLERDELGTPGNEISATRKLYDGERDAPELYDQEPTC